ncbi:hypothetical protein HCA61_21955 [Rhodococcus sp. HNM0563]|uniref:hypothetical protein n=1 Tax=Rhodococcus sp. HNM0563 TaxID=2716339 RepID=UPI00146E7B4A|nr:hypothetical protein [Rhodococcus sp. HNM0563]NLU64905.1 hypothetical protein [Rhodococcus sp. HNM0563]
MATLTACSQTDGESTPDAGTGVNRPDAASTATTSDEPATAKFGQGFTFRNGLAVTVGMPEPFAPSGTAAGFNPGDQAITFTITIVNGSPENYDPALFTTTLQSGNREASKIYDSASNIGETPTTVILPGRESEFQVAYSVTDPTDLVMEVSPGFEYRDAIFTF